ncbi:MFS transporter [Methylobacterium sp. Leaf118]|uniref:MFS transporter n=1 Tax=Methylobacterium sp. Leaf118 TaxID=2876562 RepID=UPI001E4F7D89|nr:MFS transporter [Methylobacterium sp. Leaf118]
MSAGAPARRTVAACCLGVLVVGSNSTGIMTALPALRSAFALDPAAVEWVVNAYLLSAAIGVMAGGAAIDRIGAARVCRAGLLLFVLASAMLALAPARDWLPAGRALQGIAAALAVPGTLAAIGADAAPEERGARIGAWAGCLLLGFSLGPLLGGLLTHAVSWRALFCADGVAMLAAACLLPAPAAAARAGIRRGFDAPGFLLLGTAMIAAILALQSLSGAARAPLLPLAWLGLCGASLMLLRRRERACADPLLSPALGRVPGFLPPVLVGSCAMFCILPLLMVFNLEAQRGTERGGLGLTAVEAGLALLPMSASLIGFALWAPRLVRAFGSRRTVAAGLVLVAAAELGLALAGTAWAALCAGLCVAGAGLALPYATAPRLALAALPPALAGQGAGFLNACTLLAGSAGVTLAGWAFRTGGLPLAMGLLAAAAFAGLAAVRGLPDAGPRPSDGG